MGVVNVTPDSFSDGGVNLDPGDAAASARRMLDEGAAIVDVGGESTRPGAEPVGPDEELRRVIPVLERLQGEVPVSIDTSKAEVARRALELGAELVNDVTALRADPEQHEKPDQQRVVVARDDSVVDRVLDDQRCADRPGLPEQSRDDRTGHAVRLGAHDRAHKRPCRGAASLASVHWGKVPTCRDRR